MSGKTDFHVDISKYPGGEFLFSTWGRKNSSEESNETSEKIQGGHIIYNKLINLSTEEIENPLVGISDYPVRGGKILRTYDFILPKFHFIPPKFYFSPT